MMLRCSPCLYASSVVEYSINAEMMGFMPNNCRDTA
jgi:hypothetical protein